MTFYFDWWNGRCFIENKPRTYKGSPLAGFLPTKQNGLLVIGNFFIPNSPTLQTVILKLFFGFEYSS
jgi:hypothetical protein